MKVRYYIRICYCPVIEVPEIPAGTPAIQAGLLDHMQGRGPRAALAAAHDPGTLHSAEFALCRRALLPKQRPRAGARGLGVSRVYLVVDSMLRPQLAVAAGADLRDSREILQQLLHFPVSLDMIDAVGLPGPVVGRDEEVTLDLGQKAPCIIFHQSILGQKIAAEDRLFYFGADELMGKDLSAQIDFSRGGAKGRNVVAAGAGQSDVDRPGSALRLTLGPQGNG